MSVQAGSDPGETVACPHCDLLQGIPPLPPGGTARCPRCASTISTRSTDPIDRPLAFTFAALFAFIVANTEPLMGLPADGAARRAAAARP